MALPTRALPGGSSAFELVMQEIHGTPSVEISVADDTDYNSNDKSHKNKHSKQHHEEGMMVHGLHHCYRVEGGQCLTSFRCNHDHHRVSNGHLEDITHVQSSSPTPIRKMSISSSGAGLLSVDQGYQRARSNSDASQIRRNSLLSSPRGSLSPRRNSNASGGGSGSNSPRRPSMSISPKPQRRGSNVNLEGAELHYVYDQYFSK